MKLQKWMIAVLLLPVCILFLTPGADMIIVGHRGASGYEPENTLSSFQRALDMGVRMIELDVYVCKTGELVVMHDDEVDRTTNGHGHVVDMTFDQLRDLVVDGFRSPGHAIIQPSPLAGKQNASRRIHELRYAVSYPIEINPSG